MRKLFLFLTAILFAACSKDDALVDHLNGKIDNLEGQLIRMYRVNQKLTAEKDALLLEIDARVAEIATLNELNDALSFENSELSNRISALLSDIDVLNDEVSVLNGNLEAANEVIVGLNSANTELESEIKRLEWINNKSQDIISGLEFELDGMYDNAAQDSATIAILTANLNGKIAKIKTLKRRRDVLKAKLDDARNDNTTLQSEIDSMEQQWHTIEAALNGHWNFVDSRANIIIRVANDLSIHPAIKSLANQILNDVDTFRDWISTL